MGMHILKKFDDIDEYNKAVTILGAKEIVTCKDDKVGFNLLVDHGDFIRARDTLLDANKPTSDNPGN